MPLYLYELRSVVHTVEPRCSANATNMHWLHFLAVSTILCVLSTANADCTAKLGECVTPHAEALGGHMEAIPSWPKHKTEEVCRTYFAFESCVESWRSSCALGIILGLQQLEKFYAHLCTYHRNEYMRFSDCVASNRTQQGGVLCQAAAADRALAETGSTSLIETILKSCSILKDFVTCIVSAVQEGCGDDATEWAWDLFESTYSPYNNKLGCKPMRPQAHAGVRANTASPVAIWAVVILIRFIQITYDD